MMKRNKRSVLKTFSLTKEAINILRENSYVERKSMGRLIDEAVKKNYKRRKVF